MLTNYELGYSLGIFKQLICELRTVPTTTHALLKLAVRKKSGTFFSKNKYIFFTMYIGKTLLTYF
jgi:hypothetical protein